jgi:hypothetical protein
VLAAVRRAVETHRGVEGPCCPSCMRSRRSSDTCRARHCRRSRRRSTSRGRRCTASSRTTTTSASDPPAGGTCASAPRGLPGDGRRGPARRRPHRPRLQRRRADLGRRRVDRRAGLLPRPLRRLPRGGAGWAAARAADGPSGSTRRCDERRAPRLRADGQRRRRRRCRRGRRGLRGARRRGRAHELPRPVLARAAGGGGDGGRAGRLRPLRGGRRGCRARREALAPDLSPLPPATASSPSGGWTSCRFSPASSG